MKKSAIFLIALFILVSVLFTGCIITDNKLTRISLELIDQETDHVQLDIEEDILYVVVGKTQVIKATGLDSFGNKLTDLEEPQWLLDNNEPDAAIGEIDTTSGSTVTFTASSNAEATGKLYVSIARMNSDEEVSATIQIEIVDQLPTESDEE